MGCDRKQQYDARRGWTEYIKQGSFGDFHRTACTNSRYEVSNGMRMELYPTSGISLHILFKGWQHNCGKCIISSSPLMEPFC